MSEDRDQFEESRLRASLRLHADEVPPRLDPRLIAAAARSARGEAPDPLPVAAVAFVGGWAFSQLSSMALGAIRTLLGPEGLSAIIEAISFAAVLLAPAAAILSTAAFPLMAAAAALVVIALDQRRVRA